MNTPDQPHERARRWARRRIAAAAVAVVLASMLAACAKDDAPADRDRNDKEASLAPAEGGTMRVAFNADAAGQASPLHPPGTGQLLIVLGVYDTLFVSDRTQPGFVTAPRLATGYTVSPDAKQYTITLRDDVVFHNGQPMTARDVAYTITENLGPDADMAGLLEPYLDASGIEILDDYTIQLTLKKPNAFFIELLKEYRMGIFPDGTTDFSHPVGTGPFKFVSRDVNVGFKLEANPDYFIENQPYLDELEGVVIPQVSNAVAALKKGDIDWVQTSLPAALSTQLKDDPSVNLVGLEADYVMPLFLNPNEEPFDDVRVRQAVKLSIDRQQWADVLWGGYATPVADIPVQPGDALGPDIDPPERDVEKAKELLAEAGYPDGIDFTMYTTDDGPAQAQGPVVLAQQAAEAGIRIEVKKEPVATFYDSENYGGGQAWADYINRRHVSRMIQGFIVGNSPERGVWTTPEIEAAYDEALATTDEAKQAELFSSIFTAMSTESGVIIPALGDSIFALSPNVRGFDANAVSLNGYFGQIGLS